MKVKIVVYILFAMLTSCSSQVVRENDNVLLGDKVTVYDEVYLVNEEHPKEWLEGMNRDKLFPDLFNQIFEKGVNVYATDKSIPDFKDTQSKEKTKEVLNRANPDGGYDQIKEILFTEEWTIPSDFKRFTKKVNYWCPIKVWNRGNTQEILKAKMFYVKPTSNKKGKQVANDIFLEFDLGLAIFPHYMGLDDRKLINTTFDAVQSGKLKAYDPIYMVDKSKVPFTPDELEGFMGEPISSESLRNDVMSLITGEDWYFDAESMNIVKEVKSLGFVKKYYEDGEYKSKILFFILFE